MDDRRLLPIGKVAGAHGIRGVLKIRSYAESPDRFEKDTSLFLQTDSGCKRVYTVDWARQHGKSVLLALREVVDRNAAETLAGEVLMIDRETLPDPEPGTYYWADLIGLRVFSEQAEYLGRLDAIMATGSNDVYVVKDPERSDAAEVLIPALASVVRQIDLERNIMRVRLPQGLR